MTVPATANPVDPRQAFSSVELTRNAKGAYQWQIKVYVAAGDELVALTKAGAIDDALCARYAPKEEEPHDAAAD